MGTRSGFGDGRESQTLVPLPKSVFREYAETLLVCVVALIFLRSFVFQQSEIPSGSMEDTILIGDYVLVNRFIYAPTATEWERRLLPIREVRRGDIVVFKHPPEPEQDYIKRVIGLPGETLLVDQGRVLIDGVPIDEPYLPELYRENENFGPVTLPAGEYFMMGDHRNRSSDSRIWGTVSEEMIKGRAFMVLFSTRDEEPASDPGRVTVTSMGRKLFLLAFRARTERFFRPIR